MKHIVLVSKDATLPEYFGPYGAKYTKTPNIDELAAKGTVFRHHYTAAPSTAMAFAAMFTGEFSYTTQHSTYAETPEYEGVTLFDALHDRGYECHLLWSSNYIDKAEKFSKCYGKHTIHHDSMKFNQSCGFNAQYTEKVRQRNDELARQNLQMILDEVDTIEYQTKPVFLWIHMPHCIVGRASYGDDIDLFDELIGALRKRFGDDDMYVTADHGHMNGLKGKVGYGFDVYEPAARIPLIAPRMNDSAEIDFVTSNVQLMQIILEKKVTKLPYVLCDSAYYAQPHRKLAVIQDDYYYIYNKKSKTEELYDRRLDPNQNVNLLAKPIWWDVDRNCNTDIRQVILYPHWDEVKDIAQRLRSIKDSIWRNGPFKEEFARSLRSFKIRMIFFVKGVLRDLKR